MGGLKMYRDDRRDDRRDYRKDDRYDDRRQDDRRSDRESPRRGYDDYDDRELRDEIDRLKDELYTIKRTLEDRRGESSDILQLIKASETTNTNLFENLTTSIDSLNVKIDEIQESVEESLKKVKSGIRDEIDEATAPMETKCSEIDSRIKKLQDNLDYSEPMKEQMETMKNDLSETLASKFGSKTIGDVLQKLANINTFVLADVIGTVMLLALMCYFIISLM